MRESIGGSMLFYIVLFFLSIFIVFLASVIRYARVYRIKNAVLNYIERNEGIENPSDIEGILTSMSYRENGKYKICKKKAGEHGIYYNVELYAVFELPIAGNWFHIDVAISGETYTILSGAILNSDEGAFAAASDGCIVSTVS